MMMSRESMDRDLRNYGKGDGSGSSRRLKFISFFVNDRLGHFKQLIIALQMIQEIFNK